ncbi:hypothetical protein GDO78_011489 [Eleutherodactylus coqui]|uniref:Ig-like domain-containing protein n=1 Tax=Eleutherodactylus coqui TaxID=57060 RepID=A0A8J6F103_ELECQ|nr:hypothetical protein GDO78_011489 [Eleutherodactylus coqui]
MKQLGLTGSCLSRCFFLISFYVTGANAFSVKLSQAPASMIQLIDQTVEISCTIKDVSMDKLRLYWYRKTEKNEDTEFIISSTGQIEKFFYGTNIIQKKFTIKRVAFKGDFILNITNLDHSDNGIYYCMVGESLKFAFGNGTKLTVVDSLPTTVKPTTTKPPCKCKKLKIPKTSLPGVNCSLVIWAPLAGLALLLLIGLYLLASHTYRSRNFYRNFC